MIYLAEKTVLIQWRKCLKILTGKVKELLDVTKGREYTAKETLAGLKK